jgi:acyl carrier protein
MKYVAIISFVVLFIIWHSKHDNKQRNKAIEKAFQGREVLSAKNFYDKYFKDKGVPKNIVVGVRKVLEEQLLADLSRLSSADDFSKNLSFFWEHDSMADVEIICALEERFGIKIRDNEAKNISTVEQIVNLVHEKVNEIA